MNKEKLSFTNASCRETMVRILKSFLTAYALCAVFHAPLDPARYETSLDFAIASIYELLGMYDFKFLLLLVLSYIFYGFSRSISLSHPESPRQSSALLSVFFAVTILLGRSYQEIQSSAYCFGSGVNFIRFILALAGYAFLFHAIMGLLTVFLDSRSFTSRETHFFTTRPFRKSFLILCAAYAPFLLLSFPGKLCWDAIGQIEQVMGGMEYSTHHPLFHTLIMGGLVKGADALFHSPETGLFVYMLFQDFLLAAALASTISLLSRRGARFSLLLCLQLLYCVTPVYSNMASTAVKDVPYSAFVPGYVMALALLLERPGRIRDKGFVPLFLSLQLGVILLRNNGLYVVLFSGIGISFYLWKKYCPRERILCLLSSFAGSILAAELILFLLVRATCAASGSIGEMLSIPFQQTARYLQLYRDELTPGEREAIETVLGDADLVAASYNPDSSDPVKALYRKDASGGELFSYLKVWFRGFLKHPGCYAEGFLQHIYGWFTPAVSNSIRYEADDYNLVRQGGLFPGAEKLLIFYYRFAARISVLGILENIGAAVWAFCFLTFYQKRRQQYAALLAGLPLWISLLICMAAPCFFGHPRYAFPILFSLPFLYGFTLTGDLQDPGKEH